MNYPTQDSKNSGMAGFNRDDNYDMRSFLNPGRLTMVMWDYAFLTRHMKGDSFESYDKVLDEAVARGYNTIRIDPLLQAIDLTKPEIECSTEPNKDQPIHPWDRSQGFNGPAGLWLIEFMTKLRARSLNYTLSLWNKSVKPGKTYGNLYDLTELWIIQLKEWYKRFGFQGCVYVDLSNEFPYFLDNYLADSSKRTGARWSPEWNDAVRKEVNSCLRKLRLEFPQLLFTVSLHGDPRWIGLDLELDCMDIHFYADADQRFDDRTDFKRIAADLFRDDSLFKEFSRRCQLSHQAMAPMYRARQRGKLSRYAAWSQDAGIPLTTSESWASWYYIDHKNLDWGWLLDWAEWSVEDAIDYRMWGWTPHNYCQPQFENWKNAKWHRRLTDKFLKS